MSVQTIIRNNAYIIRPFWYQAYFTFFTSTCLSNHAPKAVEHLYQAISW